MLLFGHLFLGILLGVILYDLTRDRRLVVASAVGSVLPDLLDKPLGRIVFAATINDGRIFFHGLVLLVAVACIGCFVWKYYRTSALVVVASGMLVHQLMDAMWARPIAWYYPFLGPYRLSTGAASDYFFRALLAELGSPTEWIFCAGAAALLLALSSERLEARLPIPIDTVLSRAAIFVPPAMFLLGVYAISTGLTDQYNLLTCWKVAEPNIVFGSFCISGTLVGGWQVAGHALRPGQF